MYNAIVCKLKNIRPHPNADKINLGTACGHQVVISKNQQEELGLFFPCDGVLSHLMLEKNKLYREHPVTKEKMGGFFEANRRVRAQKFRGEKSDGLWLPLKAIEWTGAKVKEGEQIDTLNGYLICEKYFTPATRKNMAKISHTKKYPFFVEHFDTKQLKYYADNLPETAVFIVTEKLHGTSGRTGFTKTDGNWWQKLLNKQNYSYISGSRKVILGEDYNDGFYTDSKFRRYIHNQIKELGLHKGETLYYEIVGYTDTGKPIMAPHGNLNWEYECSPDSEKPFEIYVYRITRATENGFIDLSWEQTKNRCNTLGLKHVPEIKICLHKTEIPDVETLTSTFKGPLEGIVIRVEGKIWDMFKDKTHAFKVAEGIVKDNDSYVDAEEIS